MINKLNNLNEEINRMKSLFGDSNLYGNLITEDTNKSVLLVEQGPKGGIGKRIAKILARSSDEISSSLSKALKSVDPVRATKFANTEISSFDAFLRHIDDYADIWKTIIPDQRQFDNVVDTVAAFRNITGDPVKLKKLKDEIAKGNITKKQFLQTLPPEGGIYEMFDDLWESSIGGKNKMEDVDDIVIAKNGEKTVIHNVKNGEVTSTREMGDDGKLNKVDDPNAQKSVDDYYAGKTSEGGKPVKKSEEIDIDPSKSDDYNKGEVLKKIEDMMEELKAGGGTSETIGNLQKRMREEEKVLVRQNEDGSLTEVTEIEVWELTINEKGEVVGEAKIKSKKMERPVAKPDSGDGKGTDSGGGKGTDIGGGKPTIIDHLKNAPNFIRWMFPTVSEIGKYTIGLIPYVKNFWKGDRFMFTNILWNKYPGKMDGFAWKVKWASNRAEDGIRVFVVEPIALVGITGLWYEYVEGAEIGDDESKINAYIANYPNTWVSQIHPFVWITKGLVGIYGPVTDGKQLGYANCRQKVEKSGVPPNKVNNHPDFTACKTKVDNFFKSIEDFGEKLKDISERYDYENWGDEEKMKFCENKPEPPATEGPKTLLFNDIDDLIERMKTIEDTNEDMVGESKRGASVANYIIGWIEALSPVGSLDVGGVADADNIKDNLLKKFKNDKGDMSVPKLESLKRDLEKMCSEYFNQKTRQDEPQYKEPTNSTTTPTDSTVVPTTIPKDSIKNLFGVNIEVEQIDIDISDLV